MAEYDLVIRGGTIVDGTRIPSYKADLAVKDGKIAKISGNLAGKGTKEVDASGCNVAPGVVDLHCHYDAQVNWDPYCTLSGWHGVTSLTIGQCGFGFAPTKPEDRESNMQMMCRIEAIPLDSMRAGMRWDWVTFPEYLDSLDRQGLGLNIASLFPYSPLRAYVIGVKDSRERTKLTDREMNEIKLIFREGMQAGAFGFSADKSLEDRCEDGAFLPTHVAADEEFFALAEILREFGVGHIGWTRSIPDRSGANEDREFITKMMELAGRPLHWSILSPIEGQPEMHREQLRWLEDMHRRGLPIYAQSMAYALRQKYTMEDYNLFDTNPHWLQATLGTPQQRLAKLGDPEVRVGLKEDMKNRREGYWDKLKVLEVVHERNHKYEGYSIADIAQREGKHVVDAFLDLSVSEDLRTLFGAEGMLRTPGEILAHPMVHISLSDGGAHTRYQVATTWPTYFLTHWVREQKLMSIEDAHYKMSALPAWIAGFRDRGTLREGMAADVIVYDFERLNFIEGEPVYANDFPGGERRLIQKAAGYRYTIVNGVVTFEENEATGDLPGKVLRSYDMAE